MAEPSFDKELKNTLAQIEKQFGKGAIMQMGEGSAADVQGISTGALSLDLALGGRGLPRGRILVQCPQQIAAPVGGEAPRVPLRPREEDPRGEREAGEEASEGEESGDPEEDAGPARDARFHSRLRGSGACWGVTGGSARVRLAARAGGSP